MFVTAVVFVTGVVFVAAVDLDQPRLLGNHDGDPDDQQDEE